MKDTDWGRIEFFRPSEFTNPEKMSYTLIHMLDKARMLASVPFVITSSYRKGDDGSHGDGEAVDISCIASFTRFRIVSSLLEIGFTRIGVYDRHIHADVSVKFPSEVIWWGESK